MPIHDDSTSVPNNDCDILKEHDNRYDAEFLHIPACGAIVDDSTIRTLKRSNVTKVIAIPSHTPTKTKTTPSLTTVRSTARNHERKNAIVVVNQATETLIETVNRSFITAGGDQGTEFRNEIKASVDLAAICIRRFSAANRQALMSHHVQHIQDTVAWWYTIMEGASDTFVAIDNGIIEEAIQETMNQLAYKRRLQQREVAETTTTTTTTTTTPLPTTSRKYPNLKIKI